MSLSFKLSYSIKECNNRNFSWTVDTNWEPGKRYTYTLTFCGPNGGAGFIDPNPSNPKNSSDPDVDLNPIPGGNAGDPVLGAISFNVTVDPWIEDPVIDINM